MTPTISPMTLGDIFDRWFKLIGKTWLRNLILSAIILGPAALVFAIAFDIGFSEIASMAAGGSSEEFDPDNALAFFEFFAWIFVGLVLILIGTVAATVAVVIVSAAQMSGQEISWQEALRMTFGIRLVKVFGQYILEFLAFGVVIGVSYAILIAGIAAESVALGLLGGFMIFAAMLLVIYAAISFAFTIPIISWENEDIIAAFRRSWTLVRDHWWRTFGILILMGMVVSFALSVIMTPLYIIVLWDFFKSYFEIMSSVGSSEPNSETFSQMFASFGFSFAIMEALSSILQIIVAPLYSVVMYFDLRARRGEFRSSGPETALPTA